MNYSCSGILCRVFIIIYPSSRIITIHVPTHIGIQKICNIGPTTCTWYNQYDVVLYYVPATYYNDFDVMAGPGWRSVNLVGVR